MRTTEGTAIFVLLLAALGVLLAMQYEPPQAEWCTPDSRGEIALEREVRAHFDAYRRNPQDPPPYSVAEARRILLAECDR